MVESSYWILQDALMAGEKRSFCQEFASNQRLSQSTTIAHLDVDPELLFQCQ